MLLVLSWLLNTSDLAAYFEQVIVPVICFLVICFLLCLPTWYWCVSCQQHICHWLRLLCIYGVLADFEHIDLLNASSTCALGLSCSIILVQCLLTLNKSHLIRLFFTWVLCIYIILDKGCHNLYAFGLNSTVCSHIVDVHLSSDQVTYDFMMYADLYNSFLLHLRIKSFQQPSVCISLWYYILVKFGMPS